MFMSMQDDVINFRTKYNLPIPGKPTNLDYDMFKFKVGHLEEELDELKEAFSDPLGYPGSCKNNLMMEVTDALVDLCYVAIGTSLAMGVNFQACWDKVHEANMSKVNANEDGSNSKRGHKNDIIKPPGWTPPDFTKAMYVSIKEKPSILLSAHQIIDNRSEESQRQYGSIDTNCDDAATIASVIQNKVLTASDVLSCLIGLKLSRHKTTYKQDNLLDAVAYLGALDNRIQLYGDER